MMGSSGFLLIFAAVNIANFRMAGKTGSNRWVSLAGGIVCMIALVILIVQRATTSPMELLVLVVMIAVSFGIEILYRKWTGRMIKTTHHQH